MRAGEIVFNLNKYTLHYTQSRTVVLGTFQVHIGASSTLSARCGRDMATKVKSTIEMIHALMFERFRRHRVSQNHLYEMLYKATISSKRRCFMVYDYCVLDTLLKQICSLNLLYPPIAYCFTICVL